jgi:alpha-ketoglutarate-dependent taurine dioxygenase
MTSSLLLALDQEPGSPRILRVLDYGPGWAAAHRDSLRYAVNQYGSVLVRGLALASTAEVRAVFRDLVPAGLMTEREPLTPRTSYGDGVYSATKWPANQPMCMHHEFSYAATVPGTMLFACLQASGSEGATTVADATAVLEALPGELVSRFEREGWLLTRNYNTDVGASIAETFGTDDRGEVTRYCRANGIEIEWRPDGALRTRQRRAPTIVHPVTGHRCWFNQIAFLNEWTLDPEVREFLIDVYGPDGLPFNTYYGNGDPISADLVALISHVYHAHTLRKPWQAGDLLMVDNIRCAHAREAFTGPREVLVGLADPIRRAGCGPSAPSDIR